MTKNAATAEKVVESRHFNSVDEIKLGMTLKDPASGLIGMADKKVELLSGTVQYAIQPKGDGKTVPDSYYVDDFMLEFVDEGVSARLPAPDKAATFRVGERLKDRVSGYVGIAIQKTYFLNGCIQYHLRPAADKKTGMNLFGEAPNGSSFDHKTLEKVDDGVLPPPTKKAEPFKRSATGGPTRKCSDRQVF